MAPSAFQPPIETDLTDSSGKLTEVWRIFIRNLGAAVGAVAPITSRYWLSTSDPVLSNEQNIGALTSGYLKITTSIGIAVPSTATTIPQADVAGLVPALAVLTSGTYTPTLTNVANLSASTPHLCQYARVGSVVTVSGRVEVDPTTTATDTQLGISLPIASNFANAYECGGTAWAPTLTSEGAAILADTANDRAVMQWKAVDVTNAARYFSFTYLVI